jgi:hypothetical protein
MIQKRNIMNYDAMMDKAKRLVEENCAILLSRALLQRPLYAFGEDGCGKHGRSSAVKIFEVLSLDIEITLTDPMSVMNPIGFVSFLLGGYDSKTDGHIFTDNNLQISINNLLTEQCIDPTCLTWASEDLQGDNFFTMNIDVHKLLSW